MTTTAVISSTSEGPAIEHTFVTPDMAAAWLAVEPPRQRRVQPSTWHRYCDEMRAGTWMNSLDPIQIAPGGWVLNGRHRLSAVVESGLGQWFYLALNVPDELFDVIDAGAPRTAANVLEAEGVKYARDVSAVSKLIYGWQRGAVEFKAQPSRTRGLEIARQYEDSIVPLMAIARSAAEQTIVKSSARGRTVLSRSLAAFCALLEVKDGAEGIISRLADYGEQELVNHDTDAVMLLKNALVRRAGRQTTKRILVALFIQAKNLDRSDAPIAPKALEYRSAAAFPVPQGWTPSITFGVDLESDDDE